MTRIDFYLLNTRVVDEYQQFICKLSEKIFGLGHSLYLHAANQEHVAQLDSLLWSFRPVSFLPHNCVSVSPRSPILVGCDAELNAKAHHDVLVNLGDEIPLFFSHFQRAIEVVFENSQHKVLSRKRYQFYKDRGYPIHMHKI